MVVNKAAGYLWMTLGFFFLIFFGGKLFFQLIGVAIGFSLIFRGLRILAMDHLLYNYSIDFFQDNFRK
ncbi:hypothetical protein KBC04_04610 [Candidatus Babeliales bacterium]|nr:hypothetical protein [Candidatus Babeliales bacterium]